MLKLGRYKFSIKEFACESSAQSAAQIREQELKEALEVVSLDVSNKSPLSQCDDDSAKGDDSDGEKDESRVSSTLKPEGTAVNQSNSTNSG